MDRGPLDRRPGPGRCDPGGSGRWRPRGRLSLLQLQLGQKLGGLVGENRVEQAGQRRGSRRRVGNQWRHHFGERARGGEALLLRLRERAVEQPLHPRIDRDVHLGQRRNGRVHDLVRRGHRVCRLERAPPRQELEEHDPHGEEVALPVEDPLAGGLLGGEVIGRPEDDAGAGSWRRLRRIEEFGDPEVHELDPHLVAIARDEHVRRLQIPVNDPVAVCGAEGVQHGEDDRERRVYLQSADARKRGGERRAFEALHDHVRPEIAEAGVEHVHDVRVPYLVDGLRLLKKPPRQVGVAREICPQELEGDRATRKLVLGAKDLAHPTAAQALEDAVFSRHDGADQKARAHQKPR